MSSNKEEHRSRVRAVIASIHSDTPPDDVIVRRFFERYGAIESVTPTNTSCIPGSIGFEIVYKFASAAECLLAARHSSMHLDAATTVDVSPGTSQPRPNYLTNLPDLCLQKVLAALGPYDLYRTSLLHPRLHREATAELAKHDFRFDRFEWRVIRDHKMVFNERYGPQAGRIEIMKCIHNRLTTLEFDLDDEPPTHRVNSDWLRLLRDCADHLAPSRHLHAFTVNYLDFDGVPMTPFVPLFRHLTTLTLYDVNCGEDQLQLVFDVMRSLRHVQLSHIHGINGRFLLHQPFQLRSLSLHKCPGVMAPDHQLEFIRQQPMMRELHWEKSRGIDAEHFHAIAEHMQRLEVLDIDTSEQHSASAFYFGHPDLCRLLSLSHLRRLRLRFDRRFANICLHAPIDVLAYHNTLRHLTIHGAPMSNALLCAIARLTLLDTLCLTQMHIYGWEPYSQYQFHPLCHQPMVDVAVQLTQLLHFSISFRQPAPFYPEWLVRFVDVACRLETLACERGDKLLSVELMRDLVDVCRRRGRHRRRLHVIMPTVGYDDEDFLVDCRQVVEAEGASEFIRVREKRSDDPK